MAVSTPTSSPRPDAIEARIVPQRGEVPTPDLTNPEVLAPRTLEFEVASDEQSLHSQDRKLIDEKNMIFGVFDGAGGIKRRDGSDPKPHLVAAHASRSLRELILHREAPKTVDAAKNIMRTAFNETREEIIDLDMGATTAAVVWMVNVGDSSHAIVGNAGDSRVMIQHKDGQIDNVTTDQCNGKYLRNGFMPARKDHQDMDQILSIELNEGDRILICSDGITGDKEEDKLTLQEWRQAFGQPTAKEAARDFIAKSRKRDDKTAIVIDIKQTVNNPESAQFPRVKRAAAGIAKFIGNVRADNAENRERRQSEKAARPAKPAAEPKAKTVKQPKHAKVAAIKPDVIKTSEVEQPNLSPREKLKQMREKHVTNFAKTREAYKEWSAVRKANALKDGPDKIAETLSKEKARNKFVKQAAKSAGLIALFGVVATTTESILEPEKIGDLLTRDAKVALIAGVAVGAVVGTKEFVQRKAGGEAKRKPAHGKKDGLLQKITPSWSLREKAMITLMAAPHVAESAKNMASDFFHTESDTEENERQLNKRRVAAAALVGTAALAVTAGVIYWGSKYGFSLPSGKHAETLPKGHTGSTLPTTVPKHSTLPTTAAPRPRTASPATVRFNAHKPAFDKHHVPVEAQRAIAERPKDFDTLARRAELLKKLGLNEHQIHTQIGKELHFAELLKNAPHN